MGRLGGCVGNAISVVSFAGLRVRDLCHVEARRVAIGEPGKPGFVLDSRCSQSDRVVCTHACRSVCFHRNGMGYNIADASQVAREGLCCMDHANDAFYRGSALLSQDFVPGESRAEMRRELDRCRPIERRPN